MKYEKNIIRKNNNLQTGFKRGISLSNIPSHSGKQSNPMLSSRNRISRRRVNHQTPMFRGSRQVNIINTNASPTHNLKSAA
jgi:hypothetical protein